MKVSLLIYSIVIYACAWAKHPLNKMVDTCIQEGIRDIRKSMSQLISDNSGINVDIDLRLQSRKILLDLLFAVNGIDHHKIYTSFANALGDVRWSYYRDGYYAIFYTYPFVQSGDINGQLPRSVLDTYKLLVWSANLKRETDAALFEIVTLANEFIQEVANIKWDNRSAQSKFITATKKKSQELTKILAKYVSIDSILNRKD